MKKIIFGLIAGLVLFAPFWMSEASAKKGCACPAVKKIVETTVNTAHLNTRLYFSALMVAHQEVFLKEVFWEGLVLPALQEMVQELKGVGAGQTKALGTMMDVSEQHATARVLQERRAEAAAAVRPDELACRVGSAGAGIVEADMAAHEVLEAMNALDERIYGQAVGEDTDQGPIKDVNVRYEEVCQKYAVGEENNGSLQVACQGAGPEETQNADIDVQALMGMLTIPGLTSETVNPQDPTYQKIAALKRNLFGADVVPPIPANKKAKPGGKEAYIKRRALRAKRNVALNSFNKLVAMRTEGGENVDAIVATMMESLESGGTVPGDVKQKMIDLYGEKPSYLGQMGILAKLMTTSPDMVVNLVGRGEKAQRATAVFTGYANWVAYETFLSKQRQELMLAKILEMHVAKEEQDLSAKINSLR